MLNQITSFLAEMFFLKYKIFKNQDIAMQAEEKFCQSISVQKHSQSQHGSAVWENKHAESFTRIHSMSLIL